MPKKNARLEKIIFIYNSLEQPCTLINMVCLIKKD